jgi:DNA primase
MITTLDGLISHLRVKLPDYLSQHGIDTSKKFSCLNPNHQDKTPSASIYNGVFVKCFSCSAPAMDIFTVANILEGKPLSGEDFISENVMYLARLFNVDTSAIQGDSSKYVSHAFKYNYIKAYKVVAEYLQEITDQNPSEAFLKEIRKRKWAEKGSIKLGVVGGTQFQNIRNILKTAGFTDEFIKTAGLFRSDIFNVDSVIFTIYDDNNSPIAFYSRDTKYEEKRAEYDKKDFSNELIKEKAPIKYNSSANCPGVYEKRLFPYGIQDVKNFHKIIAVEGHGCRHNLKLSGFDNVIALGGLELSNETLQKLISFGVTNIVLFLDNDTRGIAKIKDIIHTNFGKLPIDFSILDISEYSDIKDPDELIRKHGCDAIKLLQELHCLEWLAIKEIEHNQDQYATASILANLIANERSPVTRLRLINNIANILDIPPDVLNEEVDQKISNSQDRKSEFAIKVLDEAKDLIKHNPNALNTAMNLIESRLVDLNKSDDNTDLMSTQECLRSIMALKEREESGKIEPTIKTGFPLFDKYSPLPTREAFCLIVASPNAGKSAMILSTYINVLENNEDSMVVAYTNDDSRDIYFNRLVAIISKMPIKWIERPGNYLDEEKMQIREAAFKKVMDWIISERLIIKDISHGSTVEYYGKLISYYRNKYPNRNIYSTCDNLHRLHTEMSSDGERERIKYISSMIKSYTTKYDCVCVCTVEMTKFNMYERVTDPNSIAETGSLQYDANLIIFLWNEINAKREEAIRFFNYDSLDYVEDHGYVVKHTTGPLIEAIFLKNKISEFKGSINFKFYPNISLYDEVDYDEAEKWISINKKNKPKEENKVKGDKK